MPEVVTLSDSDSLKTAQSYGRTLAGVSLFSMAGVLVGYVCFVWIAAKFAGCEHPDFDSAFGVVRWSAFPPGPYCEFGDLAARPYHSRASFLWLGLIGGAVGSVFLGRRLRLLGLRSQVVATFAGMIFGPLVLLLFVS
jgi:hypothetical protein